MGDGEDRPWHDGDAEFESLAAQDPGEELATELRALDGVARAARALDEALAALQERLRQVREEVL